MIHVCTPYATDKNLGRAYNQAVRDCSAEWICVIDHDVMFLTPDAITIMHKYVELYPTTGLFTCFTNRIHPLAKAQLLGDVSDNDSVRFHQAIANNQKIEFPRITEISQPISGFLMLFSRKTWSRIKFRETGECLGVDNQFSGDILAAGLSILRMDALYVWHSYRLDDIRDKSHLKVHVR